MGIINKYDSVIKDKDYGLISFSIGIFLLPSAFVIGSIFLFYSLISSSIKYRCKNNFLKDRLNIYFLSAGLFMILSASFQSLNNQNLALYGYEINLTWIGLVNWLPFFWLYWAFKPYLNNPRKRKISGLLLLTGTSPVIFSGLGQVFFNWYGPISTLNGLVIWYQRPIELVEGLTGLFNNPNYAGAWLNVVWPFSLALFIELREKFLLKISAYFFIFGLSLSIFLTNSRSAWLGIISGSFFLFGKKTFGTIRILSLFTILILIAAIHPYSRETINNFGSKIIPESVISEFTDFQYSRIGIWLKGFETIYKYPFFGSGAGSFPNIYESTNGLWKGHAHNLPMELIISYGIPAGILVLLPISYISFFSIKEIILKKEGIDWLIYDKAWVVSLLVLLLSQMVDVQYFDGRISIIFWILLSGTRNIIYEKNQSLRL